MSTTSASWTVLTTLSLLLSVRPAAAGQDARLADAVQRRDQAAVRALLAQHVDVNSRQEDGTTALAWAAHWDDLETAELLIRAGADVDAADDLGVTPLALASTNGSAALADRLLTAGANANAHRATGESPLMTASYTGSTDVVKLLVARGAAVNAATTTSKQTALMWAVSERHPDVARILIAAGADVRARSARGFSPLLFAAREGDTESAELLLGAGIDANDRAPDGATALTIATASGREELALLLLDRGADPNAAAAGYAPLHVAVPKDMRRLIKALLDHRADPNARLRKAPATLFGPGKGAGSEVGEKGGVMGSAGAFAGATPFWLAAKAVNVGVMQLLLKGGADPSLANENGTTPLMVAAGLTQVQGPHARRGDVSQFYSNWTESDGLQAVKFLLSRGADINAVNQSAQSALHGAAYMGGESVVRLLVDRGAHVNAQDAQGQTPYRIAEGHLNVAAQGVTDWPKTAALLQQLGADTTLGVNGRTMLRQYGDKSKASGASSPPAVRPR